tara:strand:+ start:13046 stop:14140 length:1095 start_codon:yes stop_codon:yes gene_type:complete
MEQKHIFVIAGESSGDQHAANYIKEHKKLNPNHQFSAIGQQELAKVGVDLIFNSESISVVGIMEVISKYGKIRKALNIAYNHIVEKKPDLIVLVDYVEFNLKIAKFAKSKNIPVLFYIAPQVWAWREKRIKKIIGLVNHLAVVFPFEEKLFKKYMSNVTYVGHPLADDIRFSLPQTDTDKKPIDVGIFPGSRDSEIKNNIKFMIAVAHTLTKNIKIFYSNETSKKLIENLWPESIKYLTSGKDTDEIKKCKKAITASGTITLELALLNIPMIIMYRLSPITYFIMKQMVKLKYIGLVNLILGETLGSKPIVQEFVQPHINDNNASAALKSLNSHDFKDNYEQIRKILKPGASKNVAQIAEKMIQ